MAVNVDLLTFLDRRDLEDTVLIYLQLRNWMLVPSTFEISATITKLTLIHRKTGKLAFAQINSASTPLFTSGYKGTERWFLFPTTDGYVEDMPFNVRVISRKIIERFAKKNSKFLPSSISYWHKELIL